MSNVNDELKQFIPAGTEIVILRNAQHFWHTTKENVPVSGAELVDCPIRQVPVLTMEYKGFRVWFLDGNVRAELTETQEQTAKNLRFVTIEYDIPNVVTLRGELEHPSEYLHRYGVRTSGSVWVIPEGSVPLVRLRELTRHGCTWSRKRIDVSSAIDTFQEAISALQKARLQAAKEKANCERSAEERLNNNPGDINARLHKRRQDQKRIEKEYEKKIEKIVNGAKVLGIPVSWTFYTASINHVVAASVKSEAVVAADKAGDIKDRLEALGTDEGKAMAQGVYDGTVPVGIAADYLADNEETRTESVAEEKDENVFSLVSGDEE